MKGTKVNIFDHQKAVELPIGLRLLVRRACHATLLCEHMDEPCEVDVTFVDDRQIHELNMQHRAIDAPTDVLSFPLGENGQYDRNPSTGALQLGDIVISLERAAAQADTYNHSFQREVAFLTVHSMLHLLGYDHVNGGLDELKMREKQDQILESLGLAMVK